MGNRVYIETWGCQMNLHQSEGIGGVLEQAGYRMVPTLVEADVVLFNGCMVREKAEEKLLGRLGAVAEEKRRRPLVLGVGGCFGQIHGRELLARSPWVDFVFGVRGHSELPQLIARAERNGGRFCDLPAVEREDEIPFRRATHVQAMVTIAEGCSNACSYCIVPLARGPMRSRVPARILAEIEEALRGGAREILLLGQNVNAYGVDRPEWGTFAGLLRRVAACGPERIRFTSSHPRDMDADALAAMANTRGICRHLHLPLQSGSDRILRAMRRGYGRREYENVLRVARDAMPGLNVTTDIIVGYPGESEADFAATLEVVETVRFGTVYAAKYSPRPGTAAARQVDDVPREVKEERLARVLARERAIAAEENARWVGKDVDVLIEGRARDGAWMGRADDHRTVVALGEAAVGEVATVRIEKSSASTLEGTISPAEGAVR
ncbi:MAG: tRNA (N6-isopentenyl adenosine(37)-C2)-methylthiotransferase MiaB [Candidatus Bipolaricaulota bacterium]